MFILIFNMEDMVVFIIGGIWEVLVLGIYVELRLWCESMGDGLLKFGWLIMLVLKKGVRILFKVYGVLCG